MSDLQSQTFKNVNLQRMLLFIFQLASASTSALPSSPSAPPLVSHSISHTALQEHHAGVQGTPLSCPPIPQRPTSVLHIQEEPCPAGTLCVIHRTTSVDGDRAFCCIAPTCCNFLPSELRSVSSRSSLRSTQKTPVKLTYGP